MSYRSIYLYLSYSLILFYSTYVVITNSINIDTYQRILSSIPFFVNFEFIDIFSSEFLAELFFLLLFSVFEVEPILIRLFFVWLAIFVFIALFNKSGFFLLLLAITPPGELLLFNITSFFISSCFVIKFCIELNKLNSNIFKCFFLALFALMFHWSALIFLFFELFFILVFVKRAAIKNTFFYPLFGAISILGIYVLNETLTSKLLAYSDQNISYNKFHIIMVFIYPLSLLILKLFTKFKIINILRYSFLIAFILMLYLMGLMKVGSRLLFFIDFVLIFFIYEQISIYFRGKKELLI